MKIIRHGTKPEELTFQFTCYECKTVFEFQASEAKYFDTQKDGEFWQVYCPVCDKLCTVTRVHAIKTRKETHRDDTEDTSGTR